MRRWSQERTAERSADIKGDAFNALWKASERYYASNPYDIRPNL